MSISVWLDETHTAHKPAGADVEVDVLIIGAGISGTSLAWWLKDSGLSIAIVDKGDIAAGASGRNAGFITCGSVEHYTRQVGRLGEDLAHTLWQHSQENLAMIRDYIVADGGVDCDFRQQGTYSLAGSEHEMRELEESAEMMQQRGIAVSLVDQAHIADKLGARGFFGGALFHDDGECHPVKLVRGIAQLSGASVYSHHEVHRLEPTGDVVRVHTQRAVFRASFVVMATNGLSAQLHPWFADKIYPTRGQILVTEPVAPMMAAPCYCNHVLDYFRQLPDGRVLIGGFRQLAKEAEVGVADTPNPEIHAALEAFLRRHFASLEKARVDYRWAGIMGFSADGQPMVGSLPQHPQVYFMGGFTGHGIGQAFRVAKVLADVMLHGESAGPYSARRFI
ncbi:MAG: FAD-binding oxidoreductase [Myxococcales bacterium]|nr:FAD-binding oxidoreductase [Myxococcales bacterium]